MNASAERKMMLGTTRHLDYLILKERDGTGLAIKPVYAANSSHGLAIVLKVRVARMPSNHSSKSVNWKKTWPELKWAQTNGERASTIITKFSGLRDLSAAIADIDNIVGPLVTYLADVFEGLDHSIPDAIEFVKSMILPAWTAAVEKMAEDTASPEDIAKVWVYPEQPGGHTSHDTVFSSTYAADHAASNAFKVIQGGKHDEDGEEMGDGIDESEDDDDSED